MFPCTIALSCIPKFLSPDCMWRFRLLHQSYRLKKTSKNSSSFCLGEGNIFFSFISKDRTTLLLFIKKIELKWIYCGRISLCYVRNLFFFFNKLGLFLLMSPPLRWHKFNISKIKRNKTFVVCGVPKGVVFMSYD